MWYVQKKAIFENETHKDWNISNRTAMKVIMAHILFQTFNGFGHTAA